MFAFTGSIQLVNTNTEKFKYMLLLNISNEKEVILHFSKKQEGVNKWLMQD